MIIINKIVAAFRGMHVSPVKHSYLWLPKKCDHRTDTQTDEWTDRRRTKWSLCAAMLRRRHKNWVNNTGYLFLDFLNIKVLNSWLWCSSSPVDPVIRHTYEINNTIINSCRNSEYLSSIYLLTLSLPTSPIGNVIADCQRWRSATWTLYPSKVPLFRFSVVPKISIIQILDNL